MGFEKANNKVTRRLIVGVEAKEKCGKTNFMLSAPGPLAVFDFNKGLEGVVGKFVDEKDIYVKDYTKTGEAGTQKEWEKKWKSYAEEYRAVLKDAYIRTIGVDTSTEAWELARLAAFGQTTKVLPRYYGPVNEEFRNLIYAAYQSGKNVILNHMMKEEYVASKANTDISNRTGRYIRRGFADSAYMVQVNIKLYKDEDGFAMEILDCRQNADIIGLVLNNEDINFRMLGTLVFPDTDESDWV